MICTCGRDPGGLAVMTGLITTQGGTLAFPPT
jgi:hypothetical protein